MRKGDLFGVGSERRVYHDLDHNDRLIKIDKEDRAESIYFVKGRYYLTKLLHQFLPEHIPDIYLAAKRDHSVQIVERRNIVDPLHHEMREMILAEDAGRPLDIPVLDGKREAMEQQTAVSRLIKNLKGYGVTMDKTGVNFGRDNKGGMVYVEALAPWMHWGTELKRNYDPEVFLDDFPRLGEERRRVAQRAFYRLEQLYLEEEKRLKP